MLDLLLIAAVAGYFLGALPCGYLVARSKGINIFEHGSKNPGATNVRRVLGEKFGASGKRLGNLVFFLDALKGAVATGWPLIYNWEEFHADLCIAGLVAALLGHSFSCFTKFKGGKGVATATGGLLVLMPAAIAIALAVWLATFYSLRYVSLASILAALTLPVAAFFLKLPPLLVGVAGLIAAFVVLRHRTNIARLLDGTENKFAKKPAATQPPAP